MKRKIILTRRWPENVEAMLCKRYDTVLNHSDEPFDSTTLSMALMSADAVLTTVTDKLDASVFDVDSPRAGIIANYGVGYSHIDIDAANRHSITVTNTPDVLSECTADIAMTLLMMVARRASAGERELRSGQWTGWRPTHLTGSKVSGKTLGVVGFGRIGRAMAQRAHHGFGMKILAFNRSPVDSQVLSQTSARQIQSLDELCAQVDFLSLHCPGGDANRHLINADNLARLKPDAYLINTARGEILDQRALIDALRLKKFAGAALDVYDDEPFIDPDLLQLDNCVLLPHLGSATTETREAMGYRVVRNLEQYFHNIPPTDKVA